MATSDEFLSFLSYQCDRITIKSSTARNGEKRLKPTRTLVRYLSEVSSRLFSVTPSSEPVNAAELDDEEGDLVSLDFSTFYLGGPLLCAILRALTFFEPSGRMAAADGAVATTTTATPAAEPAEKNSSAMAPQPHVVVRIRRLNLSQNGVDNAVVNSLCELLRSGRCQHLRQVELDRNEFVALEAGQMLLRTLGWHGPLGDGINGLSHDMTALQAAHHQLNSVEGEVGEVALNPIGDGSDAQSHYHDHHHHQGRSKEAAVQFQMSSTVADFQQRGATMRDALPRLEHISFTGTNVPPHFVRRVAALLESQ